jgi:hypothetical protein
MLLVLISNAFVKSLFRRPPPSHALIVSFAATPCPFGTYKTSAGLAASCTLCSSSGLADSPLASTSLSQCSCISGYAGSGGTCTACSPSTFMMNSGTNAYGTAYPTTSCFTCSPGSTSLPMATSCTCSNGYCSLALNDSMIIYPLNDTTIYSASPALSDTSDQYLSLSESDGFTVSRRLLSGSGSTERSFLLFDISDLPSSNRWTRIVLRLYQANSGEWSPLGINLWSTSDASSNNWANGNAINWDNRPTLNSQIGRVQLRSDLSSLSGTPIDFDISSYIRMKQSSAIRYITFALIADSDSSIPSRQQFGSMEHDDMNVRPRLIMQHEPAVTIADADTSIVPITKLLSDSFAGEPFLRVSPMLPSVAYLRFNISSLPQSYTSAWMRLIVLPQPNQGALTATSLTSSDWDEFTQANSGQTLISDTWSLPLPGSATGWLRRLWNITSYLQSLSTDTTAVSFMISQPGIVALRPIDIASRMYCT